MRIAIVVPGEEEGGEEPATAATGPRPGTGSKQSPARRGCLVGLGILSSFLTAGVIFGLQSIRPALLESGAFAERCSTSHGGGSLVTALLPNATKAAIHTLDSAGDGATRIPCTEQRLALSWMFALASTTTNAASLPVGLLLDRVGPRLTNLLGSAVFAGGTVLFGLGAYTPGFLLLGLGGPFLFISCLHLSMAFPALAGFVMAAMTGAFDASSLVFYLFDVVYRGAHGGISLQQLFLAYTAVPALLAVCMGLLMPSVSFGSSALEPAEGCAALVARTEEEEEERRPLLAAATVATCASEEGEGEGLLPGRAPDADAVTCEELGPLLPLLRDQLTSPHFWGVTLVTCVFMNALNFFISTLKDQLEAGSLAPEDVGLLMQLFNLALPAGGIASIPLVGALLNVCSFQLNFLLLSLLGVLFAVPFLMSHPSPALLAAGILVFVVLRPWMYALGNAFVARTFGFRTFGTVYGCMTLLAGLSNLAQYGLTYISLHLLPGMFWPANTVLLVGMGMTLAFPAYLTHPRGRVRPSWQRGTVA